jgi:hypothetical protein
MEPFNDGIEIMILELAFSFMGGHSLKTCNILPDSKTIWSF